MFLVCDIHRTVATGDYISTFHTSFLFELDKTCIRFKRRASGLLHPPYRYS